MQDLGYRVSPGILAGHKKIADLISYQGPVLSHFRNAENEDFLYYWIDENEVSYRWLVFKIDIFLLKEYLSGGVTLRELISNEKIQYYLIADYTNSKNNEFENVFVLERGRLNDEYLPDTESYYLFDVPAVYQSIFNTSELTQIEYLQLLKENAFFIKFAETEIDHKHILSIDNLTAILEKVKKSFDSYVEESFKKNFLILYTNITDLNKAIDRIVENLQLRVVDAKIASFGIGLSADTIMLKDDIKREIREWSKTIINDYNHEVIELDYYDTDNVNYVLKNYSPEARRKIFKPILDIFSNADLDVSVSEKNLNSVKKVKKPSKALVKQLTEMPLSPPKAEAKEKEFVTIAVEVDKGADLDKIPKKVFSSQPLFEKRSDTIELTKPNLVLENIIVTFKFPLILNVSIKSGIHTISASQINLTAEHEDLNEAVKILTGTVYNHWLKFNELNMPIEQYAKAENPDPVLLSLIELIENVQVKQ